MAEVAAVVEIFLDGAQVVAGAVADPAVGAAWGHPSVLEGQLVGALAGHLCRGGVWVVADYLDAGNPAGPLDFESAGEYFAAFAETVTPSEHQAIRDRASVVGSVGQDQLVRTLMGRLDALEPQLRTSDPARLVAVIGGKVMRLGDYLATRVVEQTVHLDDLARSLGRDLWPVSSEAHALTIEVATETARRRHGATSLLRALYRQGFADQFLPVL